MMLTFKPSWTLCMVSVNCKMQTIGMDHFYKLQVSILGEKDIRCTCSVIRSRWVWDVNRTPARIISAVSTNMKDSAEWNLSLHSVWTPVNGFLCMDANFGGICVLKRGCLQLTRHQSECVAWRIYCWTDFIQFFSLCSQYLMQIVHYNNMHLEHFIMTTISIF